MEFNRIIELKEKIESLVNLHTDELKELYLIDEDNTETSAEIKKRYDEILIPGRLLHIGIVGRVKAGKSSLLNSMFFDGEDILPKAATPMTAALTKLKYSEIPYLKINFFESSDIEIIKNKSKEYELSFKKKVDEIFAKQKKNAELKSLSFNEYEIKKRCEFLARNELSANVILAGAEEQYKLILSSDEEVKSMIGKSREIKIDKITNVGNVLSEYVGVKGKYTSIIKDVEICLPLNDLKDVTIVDTPGFDDPVLSRDAAARNALKKCDVIFILSPAGQFCNSEDVSNIEKIEKGEGIQDLFIIATKIDSDLGNEAKDQAEGDIQREIEIIVSMLRQTLSTLINNKLDEPIKTKLKEELENHGILYTSGLCQSMYEKWAEFSSWSPDLNDVWDRLKDTYPDYFTNNDEMAKETIRLIGNIENIKDKIQYVREKKDEIIENKKNIFVENEYKKIVNSIKSLNDKLKSQKEEFEKLDIDTLKEEQKKLSDKIYNLKAGFQEALIESFDSYIIECKDFFKNYMNEMYEKISSDINSNKGSSSEQVESIENVPHKIQVKDPGILSKIKRFFKIGGYHTETKYEMEKVVNTVNYNYINATEVRDIISDFADFLKENISLEIDKERQDLRVQLKRQILEIWSQNEIFEYSDTKMRDVQISQIIKLIPECKLDITWSLPAGLQSGGRLRGEEADNFFILAKDELRNIRKSYNSIFDDFISNVENSINYVELTENLVLKMKSDLDQKIKAINEKETTLKNYEAIQKELETLILTL